VKGREQTQTWADWTWRQPRHTSRDKSVQAFPAFCTASDKSWAWRPGNEARVGVHVLYKQNDLIL